MNMNNQLPQSYNANTLPTLDDNHQFKTDTTSLIINPQNLMAMSQFAETMSKSKSMIPAHMQNNVGDCMAVTMQAMQWGMNPFAVAQKTFLINGILGYEAQLVNAVITSRAPIDGRLKIEWFGNWEKILGNMKEVEYTDSKTNKKKKFKAPNWTANDEKGVGVRVYATIRGEDEPRELKLLMTQANTRNSPLWVEDPKQQLAYLAIKRWARLHCPDVIMGVYTPDELTKTEEVRDITPASPAKKTKGNEALLSVISGDFEEEVVEEPAPAFDIQEFLQTIEMAKTMREMINIGNKIKSLVDDENIPLQKGDAQHKQLGEAWSNRKNQIEVEGFKALIDKAETSDEFAEIKSSIEEKASDIGKDYTAELQDYFSKALSKLQ